MRLRILLPALLLMPFLTAAVRARDADTLCVMTYNLRYASDVQPEAWSDRRPLVRECIERIEPDVIGTQEGLYSQLNDVAEDLKDYRWIGLGREGGSRGEFMAVFYRPERLEPLAFDHFWLSDTPELIGSATWGNTNRRIVTWVRFRDRRTSRDFSFWNTHFDHEVQPAREKSARLIRDRIARLPADSAPLLLAGDFNAAAGANPAYEALVGDGFFRDTWQLAKERRNERYGTFNGFGKPPDGDTRIDWILARGAVDVEAAEVVTFTRDGRYPSDHYPVVAWLRLGPATR